MNEVLDVHFDLSESKDKIQHTSSNSKITIRTYEDDQDNNIAFKQSFDLNLQIEESQERIKEPN